MSNLTALMAQRDMGRINTATIGGALLPFWLLFGESLRFWALGASVFVSA
jgi:hypothetical protein